MGLKGLAEGIIIQSMEDLWNENLREESISFFKGEDFILCAELAGMKLDEQVKLLNLVKSVIEDRKKVKKVEKKLEPGKSTKTRQRWQWHKLVPAINH